MRYIAHVIGVSALSLVMTGCLSVLPDPQPAAMVYRFSPPAVNVPPAPNAMSLRVDRPTAPRALSGQSIIVSPDATRLVTASQARWSEDIPILVQQSLLAELGQHPTLIGVGPLSGARTDLRLHLSIRNFEAQFDQGEARPPMAIVHYTATLSDASTRELLGTYDVRKTVRSDAVRISSIVKAQDAANQGALSDIADWLKSRATSS